MSAIIPFEKKNDDFDVAFLDLEKTQKLCQNLMKTQHYSKMGEAGIFAIVQKAKTLGMNPLDALNGGLYFVQGKVEMSGQSMLALIRKAGHSVTIDSKSSQTHVIMHGKRCDNGDMWTVSFGVEDAKKAGIYKATWEKYPQTMCIWRCVSMLGRFLFSDVIKGCYVEGEIKDSTFNFDSAVVSIPAEGKIIEERPEIEKITDEQLLDLLEIFEKCKASSPEWCNQVEVQLAKQGITKWIDMPLDTYNRILKRAQEIYENSILEENIQEEQEVINE